MLTKKTPETIPASLTVKAQGQSHTLKLTYHNHKTEDYQAHINSITVPESVESKGEMTALAHYNAQMVMYLVKSFDDGTEKEFPLNIDGLVDLEMHWPNTLIGIVRGYHQARGAAVEKN